MSGHGWPTWEEYIVIVAVLLYTCFVCYHIDTTLDAGV